MPIKKRFFTREYRFMKRKKQWKPFRFVGSGLILMIVIIFCFCKFILGIDFGF
ncbi:MAG: hypothetical protein WBB67_09285 [bacterium]